jgi:Ca2+-transporting ATPase
VSKTEKIVNEVMWRNVFGQAFYQITILLLFLFEGKNIFNLPYEETDPFYYTKSW